MNLKKIKKAFTVLMIIATVALGVNMLLGGAVNADVPIPSVDQGTTPSELTTATNNVLSIVAYLCYAAAVILLIMLGIKYMTQAPDGKAEIKKMAVTYVVGAVLVFAAGVVLSVISSVSKSALGTGGTTPSVT